VDQQPFVSTSGVQEVNQLSLDRLLRSTGKVVVVEFYLPDCPACAEMAPLLEEMSRELEEQAVFAKVNAEGNMDVALQYGVLMTPTFKLFCGQRFLGEIVGSTNATVIRNTVRDVIRRSCASAGGKISYEPDGYA